MEAQLQHIGLEHRFPAAVDGREMTSEDRDALVDEEAVARHPDWLTPGQIGCALSHLQVYREIIDEDQGVALVLEDDVILPPNILVLLSEVEEQISGNEVIMLYFRAFGTCEFSTVDAIELRTGGLLVYPLDVHPLVTTAAYVISAGACRGMAEHVVPVRAGPDSWSFHYESGAIERLRCILPRPVSVRHDFKSAIDYMPPDSRAQRFTRLVESHRLFPLYQMLSWKRSLTERKMSRVALVDRPSPLACGHADN
jgi:glycosyl transferase, family 25